MLLERLDHNQKEIKAFGVSRLGLFGSFAADTNVHAESDVDLLVDFAPEKKTFDNFIDLSYFLESLLGRKVELVTTESLSKHIGPHILKHAQYVNL